jgi:hypothetical protein
MKEGEPRQHSNDCKIRDWVDRDHFNPPQARIGAVVIAFIKRSPCVFQKQGDKIWLRIL